VLRDALASSRKVYFDGFEKGINALSPVSIEEMVGSAYGRGRKRISKAIEHRNKIFHGQLTLHRLSRSELLAFVEDIRIWVYALAQGGHRELGYDGISCGSFHKSTRHDISKRLKQKLESIDDYRTFIRKTMERSR
jgi:hypothetical protein